MIMTKKFQIGFKDKRRLQRTMIAENKEEVITYIKNKYKLGELDFNVWEGDK